MNSLDKMLKTIWGALHLGSTYTNREYFPLFRFPDNDMFYKFAEFTKSTTVFKHMTYFGRSIMAKTDNKIVVHNSISEVFVIHFVNYTGMDWMTWNIQLVCNDSTGAFVKQRNACKMPFLTEMCCTLSCHDLFT